LNVPVHYCSEVFINDGQLSTSILKCLRRTVAAEYSRDLSAKCFRAQKRLAELGFRVGGTSGYGLRRMAISSDGCRTQLLGSGEYKSIVNDHVKLVPGPNEEVEVVRNIFSMALAGTTYRTIAAELNRQEIPYRRGCSWPHTAIPRILRNRKYIGSNVWNQTSRKLGTSAKGNPPDQFVVVPDAFSPIVDSSTFERVQEVHPNGRRWTREQLLQRAQELADQPGSHQIAEPSMRTLRRRLVGLPSLRSRRGTRPEDSCGGRLNARQRAASVRNKIFDTLLERFPGKINEFHLPGKSRPMLRLANGTCISVIVCARQLRKTGIMRWLLRPVLAEAGFVTLICLDALEQIRYYLVPRVNLQRYCFIGTNNAVFRTGIRLKDLAEFYDAATAFPNSDSRTVKPSVSLGL
jgi:hypothetical protein